MSELAVLLKWLIIALIITMASWASWNTHKFFSDLYVDQNLPVDERQVDISDSRLSNFGSDNDPHLDTDEAVLSNRAMPLTTSLNRIMNRICRKYSLYVQLEDKKILSLRNNYLNFTFSGSSSKEEMEKNVCGKNTMVSRLDSLTRLGNAYIAENSDSTIVLAQKVRFKILKYKYDFYDEDSKLIAKSSFIYPKNMFLLNITLSTNHDNSNCKITGVNLTQLPETKSYLLKLDGILGTESFYSKLESVLFDDFNKKIVAAIKQVILPMLTKVVQQTDICTKFGIKGETVVDSRDFSSVYMYDN